MNTNTINYITSLNRRNFTNNTQRALFVLLNAALTGTGWVSRGSVRVPSAAARLRDLRKNEYGAFDVICKSSIELGRVGTRTTYYRVNTTNLTLNQLRTVFEPV